MKKMLVSIVGITILSVIFSSVSLAQRGRASRKSALGELVLLQKVLWIPAFAGMTGRKREESGKKAGRKREESGKKAGRKREESGKRAMIESGFSSSFSSYSHERREARLCIVETLPLLLLTN